MTTTSFWWRNFSVWRPTSSWGRRQHLPTPPANWGSPHPHPVKRGQDPKPKARGAGCHTFGMHVFPPSSKRTQLTINHCFTYSWPSSEWTTWSPTSPMQLIKSTASKSLLDEYAMAGFWPAADLSNLQQWLMPSNLWHWHSPSWVPWTPVCAQHPYYQPTTSQAIEMLFTAWPTSWPYQANTFANPFPCISDCNSHKWRPFPGDFWYNLVGILLPFMFWQIYMSSRGFTPLSFCRCSLVAPFNPGRLDLHVSQSGLYNPKEWYPWRNHWPQMYQWSYCLSSVRRCTSHPVLATFECTKNDLPLHSWSFLYTSYFLRCYKSALTGLYLPWKPFRLLTTNITAKSLHASGAMNLLNGNVEPDVVQQFGC